MLPPYAARRPRERKIPESLSAKWHSLANSGRMERLALLAGALLIAAGVGSAVRALMPAPSAPTTPTLPKPTVSIEDPHGPVDVNSLPAQEVREPF
jgi:hypothetical protein